MATPPLTTSAVDYSLPTTWRVDQGIPGSDSSKWPQITGTLTDVKKILTPAVGAAATLPQTTYGSGVSGLPADYYSKVMALLQPSQNQAASALEQAKAEIGPITAAQVAPLQQQQSLIPQQFAQAKQQLTAQQAAQSSSERAANAAAGFKATSGVEQSQQANIAQGWAQKAAMLDTQEASALTDVAFKIATIQGEGEKEALTYASDLAKLVADQAYKDAEVAMKLGDQNVAIQKLDEANRHNLAMEYWRGQAVSTTGRGATLEARSAMRSDIGVFVSQKTNYNDAYKQLIDTYPEFTSTDIQSELFNAGITP